MKFFLIVVLVFSDGFIPRGQPFDTLAECEALRAKVVRELRASTDQRHDYAAACVRVRNTADKEV